MLEPEECLCHIRNSCKADAAFPGICAVAYPSSRRAENAAIPKITYVPVYVHNPSTRQDVLFDVRPVRRVLMRRHELWLTRRPFLGRWSRNRPHRLKCSVEVSPV